MNIFEYSNYKEYLRDQIATFPKKGHGQVLRIAEHLQVHPTLVSQVLNGDRDFSQEQVYRLCGYLGLPAMETDFLLLLLQSERAGTEDLKKYYRAKITEAKKASLSVANRLAKDHSLSEVERSVFYSSWIYLATWLWTSVKDGQSLDEIAERLSMTRAEATEILQFLKNAHLCTQDGEVYKMQSQHIHLGFGSPYLARHHANWRVKSLQRVDDLSEEELMFTSPFSVSKKDFLRIREQLVQLIKSSSLIIKESPAEDIACLNLDLFWIMK